MRSLYMGVNYSSTFNIPGVMRSEILNKLLRIESSFLNVYTLSDSTTRFGFREIEISVYTAHRMYHDINIYKGFE